MTHLACSEEKGATLIIWTKLGFIDLPQVSISHIPNNIGLVRKAHKSG
jgi:hypothetical protein